MSQENERAIIADPGGVIRHWGREAENVFGYTVQEALGRKVDLIIPPVLHARHWRGFNKAIENGHLRRPDPTSRSRPSTRTAPSSRSAGDPRAHPS